MKSFACAAGAFLAALVSIACGEPVPPIVPRDAAARDANLDGAANGSDGAITGLPACTAAFEDVHKLGNDLDSTSRIVGLAASSASFAIVWHERREGTAQVDLYGRALSSAGVLGIEQRLTSSSSQETPPAVASVGSTWIASWVDNTVGNAFDVRALALDAALASSGAVRDISSTAALRESNTAFVLGSSGLLAWVEEDLTLGTRTARARPLDASASPTAAAETASAVGQRPSQIASGTLADGPVLIWMEAGTIVMQPITTSGATRLLASRLDAESNAEGAVDAALGANGGAVVFGALVDGVRHEIRFRALDASGALVGDERVLAAGTDASIAAFAGGYAVSYRAPASGETPAEVRLAFVDELGTVLRETPIVQALPEGGRTTLRVSGDGQIAIAWADRSSTSTDVRVAFVRCGTTP